MKLRLALVALLVLAVPSESNNKTFLVTIFRVAEIGGLFECLGTLLNTNHVLTAANCVKDLTLDELIVTTLPIDSAPDRNPLLYRVDEIFIYPELEGNDQLAILKVTCSFLKVRSRLSFSVQEFSSTNQLMTL